MPLRPLGSDRLMSNYLRDLYDRTNEEAWEIAELIVQEIETSPFTPREGMPANYPYATGALRNSFHVVPDADGGPIIISIARYWMFVEYGARGRDGEYFVRHAIDTVENELAS